MTHEERAALAVVEWHAKNYWAYDPVQHKELQAAIAKAIGEAVAAERERAAQAALKAVQHHYGYSGEVVAAAIREGK